MIRFLLERPIAVTMIFVALMVFAYIGFRTLPISLLPPIDVPQIVVKVNYPNASPEAIEQNVLAPIRERLQTLGGLEFMESKAGSETGTVRLSFAFGTQMELAYIEVNEKIDRLTNGLPRDLDRPQVIRINTNDIPVVRLQIKPNRDLDFYELSQLTESILKKRIEQLKGVSLVDINGRRERMIAVRPNKEALAALGISESSLIETIRQGNEELPGISVEDGQFRYFLRLATRIDNPADISRLPVLTKEGVAVPISRLAEVSYTETEPLGFHLSGLEEGLVMTIHKQASAKLNELMPEIYAAVERFGEEFTYLDFELTQDQSLLLNAGIDNLSSSLLFGGLFAFGVLFIFMGNYRIPLIIGISLPSSLLISFIVFYFFELSINVISLSGLALGLGMLIDNAIIVMDNIARKRVEGLPLLAACAEGVNEVMSALISSVLTTLAVFIPLIFLSGISGALFFDQAIAVAAILGVSLVVAFVLLPMLYNLLHRGAREKTFAEDSRFFSAVRKGYKKLYLRIFAHKGVSYAFFLLLIPVLFSATYLIPTEGLPPIQKQDAVIEINWNEPIGPLSNKNRIQSLLQELEVSFLQAEADIGLRQFLLFEGESSLQQASLYLLFSNEEEKQRGTAAIRDWVRSRYPVAAIEILDAPNAFDQLFASDIPYYEVRFRDLEQSKPIVEARMREWLRSFPTERFEEGPGLQQEAAIVFRLDQARMAVYGINPAEARDRINKLFGNFGITDIKRFGEITPIRLQLERKDFETMLRENTLLGRDEVPYALYNFVQFDYENQYKFITADKNGIFQSVYLEEEAPNNFASGILDWGRERNLGVDFFGQYFIDQERIQELLGILFIAVLLLYFILAAQFESFVQPLIVILTLPLGIGGAFVVLLLTGTSLNIMSAIGMVVMLGIMVNDAILKIDTTNRLHIRYAPEMGGAAALDRALYEAGEIRLKPIMMTSVTTILALLPVIFSSGLGADLQRPLVFSVLGGLTIGTFTALYFVPLSYYFLGAKRKLLRQPKPKTLPQS